MLWFIFYSHRSQLLLRRLEDGQCAVPMGDIPPIQLPAEVAEVLTIAPMSDGTAVRAVSVDEAEVVVPDGYVLRSLRECFRLFPAELFAKAGKSAELLYWHATTRFCSVCGAPMERLTDISRRCTACGREVFPKLDTAIIVLIHRGDEILLVHAHNFSGPFFALVAGFVETGETLEEAVRREISEEVALTVRDIRYVMSQPWPYPCGLMIGFEAEYESGEIVLQKDELAEGGWYNIHNLPTLSHPSGIAFRMIDAYIRRKQQAQ